MDFTSQQTYLNRFWSQTIISTLESGNVFLWPGIGTLTPICVEEFVAEVEGKRYLMPPRIELEFYPEDALLSDSFNVIDYVDSIHYEKDPLILTIAELNNVSSIGLAKVVRSISYDLLKGVSNGKTATYVPWGSLHKEKGTNGDFLVYEPDIKEIEKLQKPFDAYSPTLLKANVQFANLYAEELKSLETKRVPQKFEIRQQDFTKTKEGSTESRMASNKVKEDENKAPKDLLEETSEPTKPVESMIPDIKTSQNRKKKGWYYLFSIIFVILFVVGGLVWFTRHRISEQHILKDKRQMNSVSVSPTPLSDDIKEDPDVSDLYLDSLTIVRGASLSEFARKYYPDVMYWVFIYIENIDIIKDYNNLPLGELIRIPRLENFKILKKDIDEDKKECRRLEFLIYSGKLSTNNVSRYTVTDSLSNKPD